MPRNFIKAFAPFLAAVALALAAAGNAPPARSSRPPNLVLIVTDDQGYADFGFQGSSRVRTPHIDALARAGIRFDQAYVSHPYCSPTRAGLMTGRYPQRFGHETNPPFRPDDDTIGLPVGEATLADLLGRAGYATGLVGKWHLGAAPPFHPLRRGFDEFYGFLGGGHDYLAAAGPGAEPAEYRVAIERNGRSVALDGYLTDAFSREAVAFVRRHRKEPFFLYLSYNAPHTPYQAPKRYRRRFENLPDDDCRTYAAMIGAVDDGVGRLVAALRKYRLSRDTLIVFLSDNGGQTRYGCADNAPLRGRKGLLYEGGVRVAAFAAWPARLAPGGTFAAPVSSLDVFATFAAAAGVLPPAEPPLDGVDLLPYLTGETPGVPHGTLYWRLGGGTRWAVRQGPWKLIAEKDGPELYDLATDVGETRDLAGERPDRVRELTALYAAWSAGLVPPRWQPPS